MLSKITKGDVHKITSGQVIIDLLSIVKELVENSIDAHSDLIEITFKEHGLEAVEVNDNGVGINPEDYQNLCLKYFTSKIKAFEDLESVQTLGFRGEALSSICAVSSIKIDTATKDLLPQTQELVYDHSGELLSQNQVINRRTYSGTKVSITELFKDLPVRRKNFNKNIKKEFNRMISFVYNYIIINPQIKFQIYNVVNGQKKSILTTQKSSSILNNFIILYGTKSIDSLKQIDIEINNNFKITGYISTISIGKGRMIKDRQYLFVNNRPIVHKPLTKIINDTYHQFNNLQYPNFVINLVVTDGIDINLTPDKSLINFDQDLEVIKDELTKFWELQNMEQSLKFSQTQLNDFIKKDNEILSNIRPSSKRSGEKFEEMFGELRSPKRVKRTVFDYSSDMFKTHNLTKSATFEKKEIPGITVINSDESLQSHLLVDKEITVNKIQFNQMELIGQFNLGFLITKLNNDLFIVDQHASDEKYNYESLKHDFKIESQLLIRPITLNLNLVETNKMNQFREVIEKNGFKINDNMQLTHLPNYKHYQFDVNDLTELIDQIPSVNYLSKVNSIIAMKACRKSIMIGQHLNTPIMKKILNNLSKLDKPWNCPHGRPTLRYLTDLNRLNPKLKDYEI